MIKFIIPFLLISYVYSNRCMNNGIFNETNGECECLGNWDGLNCNICQNENSCGKKRYCDNSFITQRNRFFECDVIDPEMYELTGRKSTMQCYSVTPNIKEEDWKNQKFNCSINMWANETNNLNNTIIKNVFNCYFDNCSIDLKNGGNEINYHCPDSVCLCNKESERCKDDFIKYMIKHMIGWAKVECNKNTGLCVMSQEKLPKDILIRMNCVGSECVSNLYNQTINDTKKLETLELIAIIGGPSVTLMIFILFLISCLVSLIHRIKIRNEYKLIEENNPEILIEVKNLRYFVNNRSFLSKINIFSPDFWKFFKSKKSDIVILNDVSTIFQPGKMTAIMGLSGSGKTSLLNAISGRNLIGNLSGDVLINGKKINEKYRRIIYYVSQKDIFMSTHTVNESINFTMDMKLPDKTNKKTRLKQILSDLGIEDVKDNIIGSEVDGTRGVSGGQERRTSISKSIVSKSRVLLFDEPTSSLDSYHAIKTIKLLNDITKEYKTTVVISIQQPSNEILKYIDNLVIMDRGNIAYQGLTKNIVPSLNKANHIFNNANSISEYIISIMALRKVNKTEFVKIKEVGRNEKNEDIELLEIVEFVEKNISDIGDDNKKPFLDKNKSTNKLYNESGLERNYKIPPPFNPYTYANSFYTQLYYVMLRTWKDFTRNIFLMYGHIFFNIFAGIVLGFFYRPLNKNLAGSQDRLGYIFYNLCVLGFSSMSSLGLITNERLLYMRERSNGYYYSGVYFISKVLMDMIFLRIIPTILFVCSSYFTVGLRLEFINFFWYLFMCVLFSMVSSASCIMIATYFKTISGANIISVSLLLISALFTGLLKNKRILNEYVQKLFYGSYWSYVYESLLTSEFYGLVLLIDPEGLPPRKARGELWLNELGMDTSMIYYNAIFVLFFLIGFLVTAKILLKCKIKEKL